MAAASVFALGASRYTERQRFKFKLSRWQCRDLIESMCAYDAKRRSNRLYDEVGLS